MPYAEHNADKNRAVQRARYMRMKETRPFHHRCLYLGKSRKQKKLPFDVDAEHLEQIWTGRCAISGMEIDLLNHRNEENHAELDRIIPDKGYTKGNVAWVSRRFNRLKSDSSLKELELIIKYLKANYEVR